MNEKMCCSFIVFAEKCIADINKIYNHGSSVCIGLDFYYKLDMTSAQIEQHYLLFQEYINEYNTKNTKNTKNNKKLHLQRTHNPNIFSLELLDEDDYDDDWGDDDIDYDEERVNYLDAWEKEILSKNDQIGV